MAGDYIPVRWRPHKMPSKLSQWIVATLREAGWVPLLLLFLLLFPSQAFDAFNRFPHIDVPMHYLGGVATGYFFHRLSENASRSGIFGPYHRATHFVLVFGLTCAAALFWEFFEYAFDCLLGTHMQLSNQDTMTDLLLGVFGGISFLVILAVLRRAGR